MIFHLEIKNQISIFLKSKFEKFVLKGISTLKSLIQGAKSEVASSSQSSSPTNSDSSSANSSDHEQTSTNMEILGIWY